MKCWNAAIALLIAAGLGRALPGQGGQQQGMTAMAMQASSSARVSVRNDIQRHILTVRVGPVSLRGAGIVMSMTEARNRYFIIPFDGWLTGYRPQMVDGSGRPMPGRLLHHVAFYDLSRSNMLCPAKPDHIFGAGGEMTDWPVQPGFGYVVRKGDRILVNTMYRNDLGKNYSNVYLQVEASYQLAGSGTPLQGIYPVWFDVEGCGDSSYDLPPGRNVTSSEFRMKYQGRLLGVGGHLHDFGRELTLSDTTQGTTIAALHSRLAPNGKILSMPVVSFASRGGYPLKRGDVIKVTAIYDNPARDDLRRGAMGIVVGYFLPAAPAEMAGLQRK